MRAWVSIHLHCTSVWSASTMQHLVYITLIAVLLLCGSFVAALPIPFETSYDTQTPSIPQRVPCPLSSNCNLCKELQLPILPRWSTSRSHVLVSDNVIGSGPLTSEQTQQIRSIMDFKEEPSDRSWLIPDVQVVLWFVLLCCFMEGILSGFHW